MPTEQMIYAPISLPGKAVKALYTRAWIFPLCMGVTILASNFLPRGGVIPESKYTTRANDVRIAFATDHGQADIDRPSSRAFNAIPFELNQLRLPALLKNSFGDYCLVLARPRLSAAESQRDVVRYVNSQGAVGRQHWSALKSDFVSAMPVTTTQKPIHAKVGPGIVSVDWLMWDFGELQSLVQSDVPNVLANLGNEPVVLSSIKRSCGCIEMLLDEKLPLTLLPGEHADLKFALQRWGQSELSLQIQLELNCSGITKFIELRLFGTDGQLSTVDNGNKTL